MDKVEIPEYLISKLGPEMKMDTHWIDVKCDKHNFYGLVVRGGKYITGFKTDKNAEGAIPFNSDNIQNIRRQALFKWWPLW